MLGPSEITSCGLLTSAVLLRACLQWMAPEVLANQRYSNKADIYSFGMVMWECCARQVPCEGLNGVQAGGGRCRVLSAGS